MGIKLFYFLCNILFSSSGSDFPSANDLCPFIPPAPFTAISAVSLNSSLSVYFHSGIQMDGTYLTGLQRLYFDSEWDCWRYEEQAGAYFPDPRSYYGSFLYLDRFYYIIGGIGPEGVYNDIWKYDTTYKFWTNVYNPTPIPPRYGYAYTSFTNNSTVYFAVLGGKGNFGEGRLDDFYV